VQGVSCVSPCGPGTNPLTPCASVSPTIYPYTVNSDGSLSTSGTPIVLSRPSSTTDTQDDADTAISMVRDAAGQFLFVLKEGSVPSPSNCQTDPIPTSNFDACPSLSVFGMMPGSASLTLLGGSVLHPGNPLRLSRIPTAVSTVTFTPSNGATKELVFVTSNSDPVLHNDNTVSVYAVASDGTLSEQVGSPYATETDPISVQAVNTNPSTGGNNGGVFVYVGVQPTASGSLNTFQVCTVQNATCTATDVANSTLRPVGTPTSTGQLPVAMLVDPTNNFLYVACEDSNQVFGFKINTTAGNLSPLSPASQPTGTQPVAIAMHPGVNSSGQFLFVSNSASSNISGFSVSTTTGSMGTPTTVISPSGPSGMAAK
jgi:Lactonase, 7-bladed beta-propeller